MSRRIVLAITRSVVVLAMTVAPIVGLASGASAAKDGTDRPLHGALVGQLTFEYDWESTTCPVTTVTDATGTMSHLGFVSSHWTHCPPVLPSQNGYTNGHVTFTAADGSELVGEYSDADGEPPFVIDIVGGTGRFAGTSGAISLMFNAVGEWGDDGLPIQPWYWQGWLTGSISY